MTGITKDELMQMASDAGLSFLDGSAIAEFGDYIDDELADFANAILERAAAELGNGKSATVIGSETEWGDGWNRGVSDALDGAKNSIRALKINTGD